MGRALSKVQPYNLEEHRWEWVVLVGLGAILLLSPVFFGSWALWSRSVFLVAGAVLLGVWLGGGACRGELFVARTGLWVLGLVCLGIGIIQMVPLEGGFLKWLSPGTARIYEQTFPQLAAGEKKTLSVSPQATRTELYRLAIMIMVFVVAINVVRTPKRVVALVLVLLGLGTFQGLYAFLSQYAGEETRLAGTFHSKNHFAGLLAMIVPLSLAMVAGLSKGRSPGSGLKYRLVQWLGSASFAQQMVIGAAGVLMGLAVLFSMSRGGLLGLGAGVTVLGCYLLSRSNLRRYSLVVFLIVSLLVGGGAMLGINKVLAGVKDASSLNAVSWQGRLDLARSGLRMIGDFPVWGSGLGTLPVAFGRYQSLSEGGWTAYSLHNDWLQMACETGLVGLGLLVVMLGIFVVGIVRRLKAKRDDLCKLLAVGALVGAGTMLLHSLWDRNLSRVTSNGIVFVALLAIAYGGAYASRGGGGDLAKKGGYWRVRLGPWPMRLILVLAGVAGLGWLCIEPVKAGLAEVRFNEYLGASPGYPKMCQVYPRSRQLRLDEYFWLEHSGPVDDSAWAKQRLEEARRLAGDNPRYLRESALALVEGIDRSIEQKAVEVADMVLGAQRNQVSSLQYKQTVWALSQNIRSQVYKQAQCKEQFVRACELLEQAIELVPSKATYHLDLAMVLDRLAKVWSKPTDNPIDQEARPIETTKREMEIALWLAPHKPSVLFAAGSVALNQTQRQNDGGQKKDLEGQAMVCFRRSIFGGPDPNFNYPRRVYQLLEMTRMGPEYLLEVTPQTVPATSELSLHLLETGRWEQALQSLELLEQLIGRQASPESLACLTGQMDAESGAEDLVWQKGAGTPSLYNPRGKPAELGRSMRIKAVLGRCRALGQLGRWEQREEQIKRYQGFAREETKGALARAEKLANRGRYTSALSEYLHILRRDWGNSQALIGAAQMVKMPGIPVNHRRWNGPIEQMYRLVIYNEKLSGDQYEQVKAILSRSRPGQKTSHFEARFIVAAAGCLAGDYAKGVGDLTELAGQKKGLRGNWGQEHLIRYFLGVGQEGLGNRPQAMESYRKAVAIVPHHRPSLKALARLGDEKARKVLRELRPRNRCSIDLGGKVRLLGYTIKAADKLRRAKVIYFWEFQDRMKADCYLEVNFCDAQGGYVLADWHGIKKGHRAYALSTARWGEVVVEERELKGDPRSWVNIRFALRMDRPPVGVDKYVPNRLGEQASFVRCLLESGSNLAGTKEPAEPSEQSETGEQVERPQETISLSR